MTYTTTGTAATTLRNFNGGNIVNNGGGPLPGDIVLTFPIAATTSLTRGMIVKLTGGYLVACTATSDNAIGYCDQTVDNLTGAAGDLYASVCVRGTRLVDGVILHLAATYDAAFVAFTKVGLATGGQVVASYGGSTAPTVCVGKCFSTQAASAGANITRTVLVAFDFIGVPDEA